MYQSCIFCSAALGANQAIQHFPVGRRVAFDARRGRLWAVCPKCARWNLAPIEERWVRVGEAVPGELAAWRYGRQLVHRRQRYLIAGGATVAAGLALMGGLAALEAAWRQAEEIAGIADRLPDLPAPEPPDLEDR